MLRQRLEQFLFPVRSDAWITILRFGLGLQVILYAFSLRRDWSYLFAADTEGVISRELTEAILSVKSAFIPRLGWLVVVGGKLGLGEDATLALAWAALLCSGLFLLAGFLCRPSAVAAWLLHLAARGSGGFITYGVDSFMTIGLFYLALAPLPDRYSLDAFLFKWPLKAAYRIGFHQRVLQLHLCFIYFFGGLAKLLGAGWWDGTSMWRALTRPPFNVIPPHALLSVKYLFPFLGIFICLLEFGYPIFIWLRTTRLIWLLLVLLMHLGIAVAMRLQLFALIMIVLNLAAFGSIFSRYSLERQRA
ncbi:MAG TPA: hypothetical protein VGH08_01965 [Chthoniobacterales bacterium]